MATRYGNQLAGILVEHYGWVLEPNPDLERYGDPLIMCPRKGEKFTPHQAWKIQTEREGGDTGADAPLRHYDPLRWQALRAMEFIETVPFDNSPTTTAECWSHLVFLARFCRREGVLS